MSTAPYSEISDMLIGNMPLPAYIDRDKILLATRNEIDVAIGFLYKTPINVEDTADNPLVRPARLLLKQISIYLSSGRTIMAAATGSEDSRTHAYGRYLINQGTELLKQIANGSILLEGAEKVDVEAEPNGPMIANVDVASLVEQFYNNAMTPVPGGPRTTQASPYHFGQV